MAIINLKRSSKALPAGFVPKRVVVKVGEAWVEAKWETMSKQTLESLTSTGVRFMVDCELHGDKCFIVTHEADVAGLRKKYAGCPVIYLSQIIGWLGGIGKPVDGPFAVVPEALLTMGGRVKGHGEHKDGRQAAQSEAWKQVGITFTAGKLNTD